MFNEPWQVEVKTEFSENTDIFIHQSPMIATTLQYCIAARVLTAMSVTDHLQDPAWLHYAAHKKYWKNTFSFHLKSAPVADSECASSEAN